MWVVRSGTIHSFCAEDLPRKSPNLFVYLGAAICEQGFSLPAPRSPPAPDWPVLRQ
jgi:hypothetical protein